MSLSAGIFLPSPSGCKRSNKFRCVGEPADADIDLVKEIYVGIYWLLPDRGGVLSGFVEKCGCEMPIGLKPLGLGATHM